MASIAAAQLLAPSNAVIRVLLPDNGGFLTVAWHNDKDIPDGKVPVARDLMKKVLAGYSKRVLGLTTLETEFEKRAALDFRPRRATDNKHDNHQKTLLNLYRFVVVKGKKKTIYKPTQPLITLFNEADNDSSSSRKSDTPRPLQRVTLGLWRSNWQEDNQAARPRRRTIATPRQLVLARRIVLGVGDVDGKDDPGSNANDRPKRRAQSEDDDESGDDEVLEEGWDKWDGVRVVSHRNSGTESWLVTSTKSMAGDDNVDGINNNNNNNNNNRKKQQQDKNSARAANQPFGRRRQTVDSGTHLTNPSIKLSKELAQMIRETGVVRDKRCSMVNVDVGSLSSTDSTSSALSASSASSASSTRSSVQSSHQLNNVSGKEKIDSHLLPKDCTAEATDEWGFNTPSPWSRKSTGGSRSSFSMLEDPPIDMLNRETIAPQIEPRTTGSESVQSAQSMQSMQSIQPDISSKPTSSEATVSITTTAGPKLLRPKGSRRRNHRRRMSALTESTQHLLDDSIGTVLSMHQVNLASSPLPSSASSNSTKQNNKASTSTDGNKKTGALMPGSLSRLLHEPPPETDVDDAAKKRIERIKQQINDAEEFVRFLPSVSFDVIKVNGLGRRQRRVLRVTSSRVLNCKVVKDAKDGSNHNDYDDYRNNGGEIDDLDDAEDMNPGGEPMMHGGKYLKVTKSHHFDDVKNVTLKSHDALLLQYHNDHDFTYKSPVASSILHEVGTRIAVAQATKKKRVQLQIAESLFRRQTRKRGIKHGKQQSMGEVEFGRNLISATAESEIATEAVIEILDVSELGSLTSSNEGTGKQAEGEIEKEPEKETKEEKHRRQISHRASKLAKLTGETEEQRLEVVLRRLIYNPESDVGRTRTHFLGSFSDVITTKSPLESLQHIRFFVDGMHQYIMQHHAQDQKNSELGRLLVKVSFTDDHVDKRSNTSMVLEARSAG